MLPTLAELETALSGVVMEEGVQASDGRRFKGGIFGRDSAIVGLDLYPWYRELTEKIILSLARLQGVAYDRLTEEEPGRIHHEHRPFVVDGERVSPDMELYIRRQMARWNIGDKSGFTYYASVDATPQYIRLVAAYCERYGTYFLDTQFEDKLGRVRTIADSLLAAADWLMDRLSRSELGLLSFLRTNPKGMRWQVLRDGATAYLHDNGKLANYTRPIESLDVQGLAFDALLAMTVMFADRPQRPGWLGAAARLKRSTIEQFWMPGRRYWAMALDRDKCGQLRQLRSFTSVPGELLETGLFDGLPDEQRELYTSSIVMHLFAPEFLTPVGIRMRGLHHAGLLDYWDYQGPFSCWVVTANIFAKGLRRQGLNSLAREMERRFLEGLDGSSAFVEFFYADEERRVCFDPVEGEGPGSIPATDVPENDQAWTISAGLRALRQWADDGEILARPCEVEEAALYQARLNRIASEPNARFVIDRPSGQMLENRVIERSRYPRPA